MNNINDIFLKVRELNNKILYSMQTVNKDTDELSLVLTSFISENTENIIVHHRVYNNKVIKEHGNNKLIKTFLQETAYSLLTSN